MDTVNTLLLLAGLLLFISVLSSTVSARLGLPLLLLFLGVGMLAGEDGPGGIHFNDFQLANLVAQVALAVILLDGGLRTDTRTFRVALKPAAVLATWGVIGSVALLGLFATWLLDVDWRLGLLLAAIVGSTDAAAVFALLRNSGVRLNERVKSTLEIESGSNDPMAILLVAVMIEALLRPAQAGFLAFAVMLLKQAGLGVVFGLAGGKILTRLLHRLNLAEGLYALLILSGGLLIVGLTSLLNGSGLLAVYIAGVIIGNRRTRATEHVLRVMDGLAWLAQAGMFVVLGLLVTPSHLAGHGWEALAMALFLMLVARPLAVMLGLWPFRYAANEIAFVSWVGLRGAVPVVLAIVPVVMGVPDSQLLFDVAFSVVLLSLLVQGATIPAAARLLKVELPPRDEPCDRREVWVGKEAALPMFEYRVCAGSAAAGRHPDEVVADCAVGEVRCIAVVRRERLLPQVDHFRLREDDAVWFLAPQEAAEPLARLFGNARLDIARTNRYFGEFAVSPECLASDLASAYGFTLLEDEAGLSVAAVLQARLGRPAVVGDRVQIGGFICVVREMNGEGEIASVGLKCPVNETSHFQHD
ncbi:MAG: potassium/proton antiporter [Azonexus sp.]|nr:potassium/proton antiporter [Azonexus sp.]MCK6412712.1 potassium/proton antiporter [Azonexus sp.]